MRFYNTLNKKLEDFKPINPPRVGIYACGPTVYDYTHIGHVRTYVFVDVLCRTLKYLDYQPKLVMNITDVGHLTSDADSGEDKIEKKSRKEGKSVWKIAKFYTDYFFTAMARVNIQRPDIACKATDYISEMIKLIKILESKGFNYKTADGIYFDTSRFPDYAELAKLDLKGLQEGARVEKNPQKKSPTDFALWKFSPKDAKRQMEWDSPWGIGFPGWHIECSAMSMKFLGETLDIHTGGVDHIPVHHTNEIAQSEVATGKKFVNYWLHAGHLLVEGKKMSKSLGNFLKVEDVERKGFDPLALRYLFLTAHYRSTMNFRWKALEGAQRALKNLREKINNIQAPMTKTKTPSSNKYQRLFNRYISDDLNMPKAIALVWEVMKSNLSDSEKKALVLDWDKVLGLNLDKKEAITKDILILVKQREKLREEKKWQEADEIRIELEEKGFLMEDTSKGSVVKKKA